MGPWEPAAQGRRIVVDVRAKKRTLRAPRTSPHAVAVLVVDVGGTHVKIHLPSVNRQVKIPTGPAMTPSDLIPKMLRKIRYWRYDRVSVGFPAPVVHGRPVTEPPNLGPGWVGLDFHRVFRRPVRVINDAAMQALGSYAGGRMLFLGLGTGLGSALIVDGRLEPMELGHLPYRKGRSYEDYAGERGLERLGPRKWRRHVVAIIGRFRAAFEPDYVVVGGGNARRLKDLADDHIRLVDNESAVVGGIRLWQPAHFRAPESTGVSGHPQRRGGGRSA